MEKTKIFTDETTGIEHIMIYVSETEFIAMHKAEYDRQQAAQATLASELSNPSTPQAGE